MSETTTGGPTTDTPPTDTLEEQRRANEQAGAEDSDAENGMASAFADVPVEEDGLPSEEHLRNALRAVMDPEIGYNIVDLGLVYEVTKLQGEGQGEVHVLMTLTSMGCPLTEVIHQQCSVILGAMPGVESVDVEFTFDPPWSPAMMEDYVREELQAMGMNV